MIPKLFFIAGSGEQIDLRYSKPLIDPLKDFFEIVPIILNFDKTFILSKTESFDFFVQEALSIIKKNGYKEEDYIVGFSLGALIAYVISTRLKFKHSFVISMTSILGEDTKLFGKYERSLFTKKQLQELSFFEYKKPKNPITYLNAGNESKEMRQRPEKLTIQYGGEYILVGKAKHSLKGDYLERIIGEIKQTLNFLK